MAVDFKPAVQRHVEFLRELSSDAPFTVFLCGPTLGRKKRTLLSFLKSLGSRPTAAARLRQKLIDELRAAGFDVVLGEDDGLENERLNFGLNAQDNELEFISRYCNAVVVIADSVGAFCELGLFTWHFVHEHGVIGGEIRPAFIVLVSSKYEGRKSYLNEGPVTSVLGFGDAFFIDYEQFDPAQIKKILQNKRSIQTLDRRGRPRKHR